MVARSLLCSCYEVAGRCSVRSTSVKVIKLLQWGIRRILYIHFEFTADLDRRKVEPWELIALVCSAQNVSLNLPTIAMMLEHVRSSLRLICKPLNERKTRTCSSLILSVILAVASSCARKRLITLARSGLRIFPSASRTTTSSSKILQAE